MERKNVILLTVVAVATLLVTVVGATFAFFSATAKQGTAISVQSINSSDLAITYDGSTTISASNIVPGWGVTYDKNKNYVITVTNSSTTADITYTMNWAEVVNGFNANDKKNLVYTVATTQGWNVETYKSEGNSALVKPTASNTTEVQFPNAGTTSAFVANQTLKPGEKITYTLHVAYKYVNENQDSKGANFSARLNIPTTSIRSVTHVAPH